MFQKFHFKTRNHHRISYLRKDTPEELTKIYKTEEPLRMWYRIFDDSTMLLSGIFDAKNDEEFIRKFFFMD